MPCRKTWILLMAFMAFTVQLCRAEEGKIGEFARLDSGDIKLESAGPIRSVYVIFNVGEDFDDLDILKFIQALQSRLFKKKFSVPDSSRKADVVLTLTIEKTQEEYWANLPTEVGRQRQVRCLRVQASYKTRLGVWSKVFLAHKGYWTYTGDAYFRDTTTNDLARAIVNPLHDYPKEKAFIRAAANGDLNALRSFLADGINIDADDDEGDTALIAATRNGHIDVIQFLIYQNADVNARNDEGWSSLTFAAYNGDTKTASMLLNNGARINILASDGTSPLDWAVQEGHRAMVTMLLPYGATTENALALAQQGGYTELARIITEHVEREEQKTDYNCSYLTGLIKNEYVEKIKHVIENGLVAIDPLDTKCDSALMTAVRIGNVEIIDYFFRRGFDADLEDSTGNTLLAIAAAGGHKAVVDVLVKNGADLKRSSGPALVAAVVNGRHEVADFLIEHVRDINARCEDGDAAGRTPLSEAARTGRREMAQMLLARGANPDTKDLDGKTPLMVAALSADAEMVNMLLSAGADIGQKDRDGNTALDLASKARMENRGVNYRIVIDSLKREASNLRRKRERLISK